MLIFNVKVQESPQLFFRLKTPIQNFMASAPGFPQGLWGKYEGEFKQTVLEAFSGQGGASGPWAHLSPEYAERKGKKYPGATILQADGQLLASFFGGGDYVYEPRALGMRWGSRNPLAGYHQRGHESPTRLPQRKMFDPDADFIGRLRSAAVRYVQAAYRAAGFRIAKETYGPAEYAGITRPEASALGRQSFLQSMGG